MKSTINRIITVLAVLILAGAVYTSISGISLSQHTASAALPLYNEDAVTAIYDNVSPAVVEIKVVERTTRFYGRSIRQGQGSGFLIDTQGHIMTNNHVVNSASRVQVVLKDGRMSDASIIATASSDDLALLKVESSFVSGIIPLQFGDSSKVKPGQMAIALGNPYGLESTITVGVISGLNRNLNGNNLSGMLQTDAAINPGNSGGPLLNSSGQVIGINTAIESDSSARGIGFAVPSNVVKQRLPDLMAGKKVTRPWLGISGTALTQSLVSQLGLSVNQGVLVVGVTRSSPAEKAGLKGGSFDTNGQPVENGDVIVAVDGNSVTSVEGLSSYLRNNKEAGDTVKLTVLRDGESIAVTVKLGEWPDNTSLNALPVPNPHPDILPNVPDNSGNSYGGQATPDNK